MKIKEVKVGQNYKTYVTNKLVEVTVIGVEKDYWSKRTKFRVSRVDNGRILDKLRSAAKLRPCKE